MATPIEILGDPAERANLQVWEWVKQSKVMAVGWLAMRVWLGIMWIQAGGPSCGAPRTPRSCTTTAPAVAGFAGPRHPRLHLVGQLPDRLRGPQRGLDRRPGRGR